MTHRAVGLKADHDDDDDDDDWLQTYLAFIVIIHQTQPN